jgi:dodecin
MGTVTKVIEVSCSSDSSMENAVQTGLSKVAETVKHVKGAWVNDIKVITSDDGRIIEWRVNMRVNFLVN